ncbi:MAG: NADP-dependent phosphogluconate dehydrogenase [Gemmatimonadota bacterium]|nr:NADP-dependent phosphogluconate dehydrogenase [Gemmatimonadota bacterium]
MEKAQIGLIGLAVMGENLVLNIERNGYKVAVFNRTTAKTEKFAQGGAKGKNIKPCYSMEEFAASLERPRKVIVMVKAGAPVDAMIANLKPHLDKGDIIIDGGNSHFPDSERRSVELAEEGFVFFGTGVSGGEYGALHGPSIMPGGPREAYGEIEGIFTKISAKVGGEPCITYLGPRGAGHYVKMVHNGIEYGDMQLICEAYDIMHRVLGLDSKRLGEIFTEWNNGELSSYLIEITADIFRKKDPETGKALVELILDKAGQKGTGKWTSQNAFDLGSPIPTINAAVESRIISAYKDERVAASKVISGPEISFTGDVDKMVDSVRQALYASKICSYAQGMSLLKAASEEYGYDLDFKECARIWRGGCIIRASFLDLITQAFERRPELPNLLVDDFFRGEVESRQDAWRCVVKTAVENGIPSLAMSASLAYFDAYRSERVPANLIQAQRDYFGAHTYEMVDRPGVFHTEWMED